MPTNRILSKYKGQNPGPLLVVFGGMHGNEPAGIHAIEMMAKMLVVEPVTNPDFEYNGSFLGLIGNVQAYEKNQRFIKKDINRSFTKENIQAIQESPDDDLNDEQLEIKQIITIIQETIEEVNPDRVVVLDLHTTSSYGGIFSIVNDDPESLRIAVELHAPVIKGMMKGIKGTTLHYFTTENFGISMTPVTFESGQHDEVLSINRAIAAITNCMRTIGSVSPEHVENQHDKLLIEHSKNLPKVSQLITKHSISEGDRFQMLPDFKNFQEVKSGEIIAKDKSGLIEAPEDGLLLMPLYQSQGEDGFFLIKKLDY